MTHALTLCPGFGEVACAYCGTLEVPHLMDEHDGLPVCSACRDQAEAEDREEREIEQFDRNQVEYWR